MRETLRMFWACTHVPLRETELPVLLEAGFEVIPEEPNFGLLDASEVGNYEDSQQNPVVDLWRQSSTVPDDVRDILRRSNLMQRRGKLLPEEITLFNRWIDVLYIATDLETAANIGQWFQGLVVFRCFGIWDFIGDFRRNLQALADEQLKNLVFCPIFDSLTALPEAARFGTTHAIHGYRDAPETKWVGFDQSRDYSLVAHHLKSATRAAKVVESVAPLASMHLTWLLGKNYPGEVPASIARVFQVAGILPRREFFDKFRRTRILIHPFNDPYHNYYTNLESVAAGIPTLLLRNNPLANENSHLELDVAGWESLGVFSDVQRLMTAASQLYDDRQALESIAEKQQCLLSKFSRNAVLTQCFELKEKVDQLQAQRLQQLHRISFLRSSTHERLAAVAAFVEHGGELPLTDICMSALGELPSEEKPAVLEIRPDDNRVLMSLSSSGSKLAPLVKHSFSLVPMAEEGTILAFRAELWRNMQVVDSAEFLHTIDGTNGKIEFDFILTEPHDLVLYATEALGGVVQLDRLCHALSPSDPSRAHAYDKINSDSLADVKLRNGEWVFPRELDLLPSKQVPGKTLNVTLTTNDRCPIVFDALQGCVPQHGSKLELEFTGDNESSIETVLELWHENKITETLRQLTRIAKGGVTPVTMELGSHLNDVVPVLYLLVEGAPVELKRLRACGLEQAPCDSPEQEKRVKHVEKPRFYGQFDPPVDQVLYETFFKDLDRPGFFIESGACDGVTDSSCYFFRASLNWSGLNIEPSPYFYEKLQINRAGERNLNLALSSESGTAKFRNAIHPTLGRHFGNGSLNHMEHHAQELMASGCEFEEFEVRTARYKELMATEGVHEVDLMVLDVEGHELSVLEGMSGSEIRPRVMCIEHGQIGLPKLTETMHDLGYTFHSESYANSFWVRNEPV